MPSSTFSKRPPAMTDVAALAGVSHQTVSRVLNDSGSVRPETRERVLEAISELGYRRNEAARALVTRKSQLIGVITTTYAQYGPSSTLESVQLAAGEVGYLSSVVPLTEFSAQNLHKAVDLFVGQGTQGIIVIAPVLQVATALRDFSIPVPTIAISSAWTENSEKIIRVGVDQRGGAESIVDHLQSIGCQSIVHISGPMSWFDAREREAGWRQRMESAGVRPEVYRGDWSAASGYQLAKSILRSRSLPDAIFAANDQMALGVLRALAEANVSVPKDIRVAGFDDEPSAEYFYPSLTTVRQDFQSLGTRAIEALQRRLAGESVQTELLPPKLVLRGSA